MIEQIFSPISWLAEGTQPQLSSVIEAGIKAFKASTAGKLAWEEDLNLLLAACRAIKPPLEKAYALLLVAEAAAQHGEMNSAQALLAEGLSLYKDRSGTQAVLEWILGTVEWRLRKEVSGDKHWKNTHETLEALYFEAVKDHHEQKAEWYKETATKLDDLVVEMASTVDRGYLLYNRYSASKLSKATYDLIAWMNEQLRAGNKAQVKTAMELLEQSTRFSEEFTEVLVECGVTAFALGEVGKAIENFRQAQTHYYAEKENRLAVTWMLAAALGSLSGNEAEAEENWKACGALLNELSAIAEQKKDEKSREKLKWYGVLSDLLKLILNKKVKTAAGAQPNP